MKKRLAIDFAKLESLHEACARGELQKISQPLYHGRLFEGLTEAGPASLPQPAITYFDQALGESEGSRVISQRYCNLALPGTLPKGQAFEVRRVEIVGEMAGGSLTHGGFKLAFDEWVRRATLGFIIDQRHFLEIPLSFLPYDLERDAPLLLPGLHSFSAEIRQNGEALLLPPGNFVLMVVLHGVLYRTNI